MRRVLHFVFISLFFLNALSAQIEFSIQIDSATVSTACGDLFGPPDETYQVVVNNGPAITYDFGANPCFLTAPNISYDTLVNGACNLPLTVEVCVRAFDNDGDIIPCFILPECFEQICVDLPIPTPGNSSQEQISLNGSTDGEFYFSLATSIDTMDFNYVCGAVDLGELNSGETLGDASAGIYNNLCADNLNEPNPAVDNSFNLPNNHGVWFTYTTGSDVNTFNDIRVYSDPQMTGDPIDLELLAYTADSCTGTLSRFPLFRARSNGDDASFELYCVQPNTTIYILVDGKGTTDDTQQGVFSIEVIDPGYPEGGDLRCDAFEMGVVPDNGSLSLPTPMGNFCAGFVDDPPIFNFISRNSVWVNFIAPASGNIFVEAFSVDPLGIDLELAFYQSSTDDCTGTFQHLYSGRDGSSFDESFSFSCLDPGRPYWLLIDGSGLQAIGYFDITITDLGDIRPVFTQTDTICAGDSIMIGNDIVHHTTGNYIDTIKIGNTNCDSIVITDLTVLEPISLNFIQTRPALGANGTDGEGIVSATGGTGDYIFAWCDGTLGTSNNNLEAGTQCCINVVDTKGCTADTCFTVDFVLPLDPTFSTTEPDCNGGSDGSFSFSVTGGRPAYQYQWISADGSLSDNGSISSDLITIDVPNMPAGDYTVTIEDQFFDTIFTVTVTEPDLLTIAVTDLVQISCFQACDGAVTVTPSGGTPPYDIVTTVPDEGDGCAGLYSYVVTDANGCIANVSETLVEPLEFIASFSDVQDVSCFDGDDGTITVVTNGNPTTYQWSNLATTETISGLSPGLYTVTVTNDDGCQDVISQQINQPDAPLIGQIQELAAIICATDENGSLGASFSGGTLPVSYAWSNGATSPTISDLGPGSYELTLTDAGGCELVLSTNLAAPPVLLASTESRDIRCPDPDNAGVISISSVSGGEGPYLYALNGLNFGQDTVFTGLEAGRYNVTVQDALGCEIIIETDILPPPTLIVDLGGDQEILLGDSLLLNALANSNDLIYDWSFDPNLDEASTYFRPQRSEIVNLTVLDTITDCIATTELSILVDRRPRVYVPNAFSPNDDGINDIFYPFGGSDVSSVSDFRIFGRYGNLVFERLPSFTPNTPGAGWDGKIDGQKAHIGVYIYSAKILFYDGREEIVKGEITLLR